MINDVAEECNFARISRACCTTSDASLLLRLRGGSKNSAKTKSDESKRDRDRRPAGSLDDEADSSESEPKKHSFESSAVDSSLLAAHAVDKQRMSGKERRRSKLAGETDVNSRSNSAPSRLRSLTQASTPSAERLDSQVKDAIRLMKASVKHNKEGSGTSSSESSGGDSESSDTEKTDTEM
jgi:hypothetical protein